MFRDLLEKKEWIFDRAPFPCCHAPTLVELRNGDLLVACFGGTAEGHPDVAIWASRRRGGRWSPPWELARETQAACYNPVLFYTRDGRLWLYYRFGPDPARWTAARRWSEDDGQTWSEVELLPAGLYGPIRTKPLLLDDGTVVSGTSVESYRSWACWVERSTDQGKSWRKCGPIPLTPGSRRPGRPPDPLPAVPGSESWAQTRGIIQPTLVPLSDRHLRLYARSTSQTGRICAADSFDGGLTWTPARPLSLPNPNSGIDALRLPDGRFLLAYNHSELARTPLNLALSSDGENFEPFLVLEEGPGEYSYPALILERHHLHLAYTWNRKNLCYLPLPLP